MDDYKFFRTLIPKEWGVDALGTVTDRNGKEYDSYIQLPPPAAMRLEYNDIDCTPSFGYTPWMFCVDGIPSVHEESTGFQFPDYVGSDATMVGTMAVWEKLAWNPSLS